MHGLADAARPAKRHHLPGPFAGRRGRAVRHCVSFANTIATARTDIRAKWVMPGSDVKRLDNAPEKTRQRADQDGATGTTIRLRTP